MTSPSILRGAASLRAGIAAAPRPRPARVCAAARCGRARLIDNVAISLPEDG